MFNMLFTFVSHFRSLLDLYMFPVRPYEQVQTTSWCYYTLYSVLSNTEYIYIIKYTLHTFIQHYKYSSRKTTLLDLAYFLAYCL